MRLPPRLQLNLSDVYIMTFFFTFSPFRDVVRAYFSSAAYVSFLLDAVVVMCRYVPFVLVVLFLCSYFLLIVMDAFLPRYSLYDTCRNAILIYHLLEGTFSLSNGVVFNVRTEIYIKWINIFEGKILWKETKYEYLFNNVLLGMYLLFSS